MLAFLSKIITPVIGIVARGKAAKAIGAGIGGAVTTVIVGNDVIGKVWEALAGGATEALVPQAHDLGFALAQAAAGYVVGHVIAWFAPANAEA